METTYDICAAVRSVTVNRCAEVTQYQRWGTDFAVKYLQELPDLLKAASWFKPIDPNDLTEEQMVLLGFKKWADDNPLMLIPLWLLPYLSETFEGGVISEHKQVTLVTSQLDNDCRMGLLAYGVYPVQ